MVRQACTQWMIRCSWECRVAKVFQENNVNSVSMLCSRCNSGFHSSGHIINEIKPLQQDICNLTLPYLYFYSHLWKDRRYSKTVVLCQLKLSHPLFFSLFTFQSGICPFCSVGSSGNIKKIVQQVPLHTCAMLSLVVRTWVIYFCFFSTFSKFSKMSIHCFWNRIKDLVNKECNKKKL